MIWVRGRIVPDDALAISVLDRTFEHGLGLFETLRTWNGQPTLLPRHLDRLTRSAAELGLPLDRQALPDREAVRALLAADGREADAMLRITLSGGISESSGSTLWMRSFALPPATPAGVILGPVGPARVDVLASHKTLNYWPNRIMYENARGGGLRRVRDHLARRQSLGREPLQPVRGDGGSDPDSSLCRQGLARNHAGLDPGARGQARPGRPRSASELASTGCFGRRRSF